MRIITTDGNRDYYDTAGWADQECLFHRASYDDEGAPFKLPFLWPEEVSTRRAGRSTYMETDYGICMIAGELYPFMRVTEVDRKVVSADGVSIRFVYDAEEAEGIFKTCSSAGWGVSSGRYADIGVFMRTPVDKLSVWALDNKAATAILTRAPRESWNAPYEMARACLNCAGLGDRELYKVVDPATAHMRIQDYLMGVLPQSHETVTLTDTSKIRKAGFDGWSFKTRPGTKKPRRKKS